MKMNDAYPSRFLKADEDVPEEGLLVLTIDRVEMETLGQGKDAEDKPVVYFTETDKGLVLNKTNWKLIAGVLGNDDTDTWTNRKIALYSADVQFGQDMMRGIRVNSRAPRSAGNGPSLPASTKPVPAPMKPQPQAVPPQAGEDDNETPF